LPDRCACVDSLNLIVVVTDGVSLREVQPDPESEPDVPSLYESLFGNDTERAERKERKNAADRRWRATSLERLHPAIAAQWHPTKNEALTPDQVLPGSSQKVWWHCLAGPDHEWQAPVAHRTTKGTGCPMCEGKSLSVTNSLMTLYPEIAAQWHPTKNGTLTPDQIVAGSSKKAWWRCPNGPDHKWPASVKSRTKTKGTVCPDCSRRGGRHVP